MYRSVAIRKLRRALPPGATIDYTSLEFHDVVVDSPPGQRWRCDSIHGLLVYGGYYGDGWADALADVLRRMACGLEPCDDAACDTCHPVD